MGDDLTRVHALLARADRGGTRVEPFRFGTAIFNEELPRRWDSNYLHVDRLPPEASVDELVAEADRIQGAAGLRHRKLSVRDEEAGARLLPELRARGWLGQPLLVMAHRRPPERNVDTSLVQEVGEEALRPARARQLAEYEWARDGEVVRQVLDAKRFIARAVDARFFGIEADGEMVSWADLYLADGAAQVEDVGTLDAYRGRGYASALVLRGVEEARAAGADLVFLLADEDDWPKELYRRLGFDGIGRVYDFVRELSG